MRMGSLFHNKVTGWLSNVSRSYVLRLKPVIARGGRPLLDLAAQEAPCGVLRGTAL